MGHEMRCLANNRWSILYSRSFGSSKARLALLCANVKVFLEKKEANPSPLMNDMKALHLTKEVLSLPH